MEYTVVASLNLGELANAVDRRLKDGWKPTGGICAVEEKKAKGSHLLYMQAMIHGS
jgi:hypothetical protein